MKGKDGLIRGVVVLHKDNYLERPVQLVCPLEIRSAVKDDQEIHNASNKEINDHKDKKRQERKSAAMQKEKIKEQFQDN